MSQVFLKLSCLFIPIIIYVSDLELWLKWSSAKTYTDDTTTGTSAKTIKELNWRMEEDASSVLIFMASNGLIANANKFFLDFRWNITKKQLKLKKRLKNKFDQLLGARFGWAQHPKAGWNTHHPCSAVNVKTSIYSISSHTFFYLFQEANSNRE